MTNRAAIEDGLRKRIEESKGWVDDNLGVDLPGVQVRKFPTRLRVLQYLDDKRVEANGMRFRLFFGDDTRQFFTDLDVRINPNWFINEGKDDSPPYIVVYALDEKGAGDALSRLPGESFTRLDRPSSGTRADIGGLRRPREWLPVQLGSQGAERGIDQGGMRRHAT